MGKIRIIFLLLTLMSVASCTKVAPSSLVVEVVTNLEDNSQHVKGVVEGNSFSSGHTFGLFVYYAETEGSPMQNFRSYGDKYANIKAYNTYGTWSYTLNGSSSSSESFFLIEPSSAGSSALAICAYAPCVEGAASITEIPFTIGGRHSKISDLMWATQNYNSDNLYIEPKGNTETVSLTFRHALSMIRIGLKCKYPGTTMQVSSVKIVKNNSGSTGLYASGEFNAVTGTFPADYLTPTEEVVFSCEEDNYVFDSSGYFYLPVLIVPTEYVEDGDYSVVFTFNGHELHSIYPIKKSDITVGDVCAFEQGKVYAFEFLFNNYAQIENINIDLSSEWEKEVTDLEF